VPESILLRTGPDLFHNIVAINYHNFYTHWTDQAHFVPAFKSHLAALPKLRALDLWIAPENSYECLGAVAKLSSLEELSIWNADDDGIVLLRSMPRLKGICLYQDGDLITDRSLSALGTMRQLERIILPHRNSHLTDEGLTSLRTLERLKVLWLSGPFTDAGLSHLEALTGLEELRLRDTNVSAAGVKRLLAAAPGLKEITVEWSNSKKISVYARTTEEHVDLAPNNQESLTAASSSN
jgi:hypothetical protein